MQASSRQRRSDGCTSARETSLSRNFCTCRHTPWAGQRESGENGIPDAIDLGESDAAVAAICCDVGDQRSGLTHERDKYMWQAGWRNQHQRLLESLNAQKQRSGIVLSGDLHAIGHAALERSGDMDLSENPVHSVLTGTLGTQNGWPSDARGTPPRPPLACRTRRMVKSSRKTASHCWTSQPTR